MCLDRTTFKKIYLDSSYTNDGKKARCETVYAYEKPQDRSVYLAGVHALFGSLGELFDEFGKWCFVFHD